MARTAKRLWPRIVAPDNIWQAYQEACRGKRRRPDVAAFMLDREEQLLRLREELASQQWSPRGYKTFVISVPKRRLISAAPFRDRVVHHAIHRVLAPVLLRRMLPNTYACLAGRGTHRAVLAFQAALRRHRWVARLDVRRYFLEIRWDRLMAVVSRQVRDDRTLALLDTILRSGEGLYHGRQLLEQLGLEGVYHPAPGKGLPIGNLTSQLFANVYLDALDHRIKRTLKVPGYVRYLDDVVLFGDCRRTVRRWVDDVIDWCATERALEIRIKGDVQGSRNRFTYLGFTVDRADRRASGDTIRRMRAKARSRVRGGVADDDIEPLADAWAAWAKSLVL